MYMKQRCYSKSSTKLEQWKEKKKLGKANRHPLQSKYFFFQKSSNDMPKKREIFKAIYMGSKMTMCLEAKHHLTLENMQMNCNNK